ncbi:Membrane-bound lytic murein transglycosylase A [Olavius algarvensis associated proteobacterium Delta 3]|nr:Membrane-bound lytic murein transglycosylase A [Olavius algarvensis associated proteobacterium Delta 3]
MSGPPIHCRTVCRGRIVLLLLMCLGVLSSCAVKTARPPAVEPPPLERLAATRIADVSDDMTTDSLDHAIFQSLTYLNRISPDREFSYGNDRYTTAHVIRSLETFRDFLNTSPSQTALTDFIRRRYILYRSVGSDRSGNVLFTGYYEPFLQGSRDKSEQFRFPVYKTPDDLLSIDLSLFSPRFKGERIVARYANDQVLPYHDRRSISEKWILEGKADILAWVNDRVDLFFLQIQGSGKIFLDTGDIINVHYDATNGHPYRSIGKLLIDEEKIPRSEMSMQRIRAYLSDHPEEISRILTYNPSYIFFSEQNGGPRGAIGVELTPGRSLATDRRLFPPGALAFIRTEKPLVDAEHRITGWTAMQRFVLNQDTGGAITGPGRADLYWGHGPYAELAAGHMQHAGELYFLVLKPDIGE